MSRVLEGEASAKFPYQTSRGLDHLAWAKRFVYRLERGDKTLLMVQIKFAKMALGVEDEVKS